MAIRWKVNVNSAIKEDCKEILQYLKDNNLIDSSVSNTLYPSSAEYIVNPNTPFDKMAHGRYIVNYYSAGWYHRLPNSNIYAQRKHYVYHRGRHYWSTTYTLVKHTYENRARIKTLEVLTRA